MELSSSVVSLMQAGGTSVGLQIQIRKTKMNIVRTALTMLLAIGVASCATDERKEGKLQAEAKVSRAQAEKIALAKVPGGTIKEGEIEKEKGKIVWSFDIATPGTADITEVQVDALNGEVVAIEKESPAQQAKEKREKD
jgi:uncharacterized membrane protein YkoI